MQTDLEIGRYLSRDSSRDVLSKFFRRPASRLEEELKRRSRNSRMAISNFRTGPRGIESAGRRGLHMFRDTEKFRNRQSGGHAHHESGSDSHDSDRDEVPSWPVGA